MLGCVEFRTRSFLSKDPQDLTFLELFVSRQKVDIVYKNTGIKRITESTVELIKNFQN